MIGRLARGDFVRLAYRLGRKCATGCLELVEPSGVRHRLWLRRGALVASQLDELRPTPLARSGMSGSELSGAAAAALRRQAELRLERLASSSDVQYRFEVELGHAYRSEDGAAPITLAGWARRHLEARVDALRARALHAELAGTWLAVHPVLAPDASECDETDRRTLAALATACRFEELEQRAQSPRFRLAAFLHFLRAVGALMVLPADSRRAAPEPPPRPASGTRTESAYAEALVPTEAALLMQARVLLGVANGAAAEVVKRAYRKRARELHPDAHPGASAARVRQLGAQFSAIHEAYRTLVGQGEPAQ